MCFVHEQVVFSSIFVIFVYTNINKLYKYLTYCRLGNVSQAVYELQLRNYKSMSCTGIKLFLS
jgi:hypothetical protein